MISGGFLLYWATSWATNRRHELSSHRLVEISANKKGRALIAVPAH